MEVVAVVDGVALASVDDGCVKSSRAEVMLIEKQWREKETEQVPQKNRISGSDHRMRRGSMRCYMKKRSLRVTSLQPLAGHPHSSLWLMGSSCGCGRRQSKGPLCGQGLEQGSQRVSGNDSPQAETRGRSGSKAAPLRRRDGQSQRCNPQANALVGLTWPPVPSASARRWRWRQTI